MVNFTAGTHVEQACAKVNLHLRIGPRRNDGYHDIASIFQMVDLCDTLTVTIAPSEALSIACDVAVGIDIQANTMVHAARLFAAETGLTAAIHVACEKHIPVQAGLGGGSSDGAAMLRVLNRICGSPLDRNRLIALGAIVGSDVPFFLGTSSVAFVHGRGERLRPLVPRSDLAGWIIMPAGSGVSTARAFASLDQAREEFGWTAMPEDEDALARAYAGKTSRWPFSNDFRAVMGELAPLYDALDALVARTGGCFGTVSGSGSAYCVVTEKGDDVERLGKELKLFPHEICLYPIKCLHVGHSDDTV